MMERVVKLFDRIGLAFILSVLALTAMARG